MSVSRAPRIVLLGMMTKMPVAGVIWQVIHYLIGFRRLGYDVFYVEAHARTPSMLMREATEDGGWLAASFIARVMRRFGFEDRWAYQALHADGRVYGLSETALAELYREAALVINLHGGTWPRPEHAATGRLVYLGTDPVQTEVELARDEASTIAFLEPHCAFFTFGENYGAADCGVPVSDRFLFKPTRQPVVLPFWDGRKGVGNDRFTTIASWKQPWRDLRLEGELYRWSKDHEFLKYLDLPSRTERPFELALSACEEADRKRLRRHGWRVADALSVSRHWDPYREYILSSRAEFTVAKDQNVRLRSGWFSDRSAAYLAAGRPVVTQDTGFGNILPTGRGLFAFSDMDEVLAAVELIDANYETHSKAALDIAREFFDHRVVLGHLLEELGLPGRATAGAVGAPNGRPAARDCGIVPIPEGLDLVPVSRRPLKLSDDTLGTVADRPWPRPRPARRRAGWTSRPDASVIVVTRDRLPLTRLCLESVLANTVGPRLEVVVVDNGSTDGTTDYLLSLSRAHPCMRLHLDRRNRGFARANNIGLSLATGGVLVLLNNDTIVPPGWLSRLRWHLERPALGAVGPVTNRISNEAQVPTAYRTYGEFLREAAGRTRDHSGEMLEVERLAMFCFALRRDVWREIGPLDETFGVGTFEDDDYSLRVREAGWRLACAEDVLVHHFGMASFGDLVPGGRYAELLRRNRHRFEEKWGRVWEPHRRRPDIGYADLIERVRSFAERDVPEGGRLLVVSRGDEELVRFRGRSANHFPQDERGAYSGYYPSDSGEAIAHLESLRERGAEFLLFPRTALWWLEHYGEFQRHLERRYGLTTDPDTGVIVDLRRPRRSGGSGISRTANGVANGGGADA